MNAVEKIEPQSQAVASVTPMSLLQSAVASGNMELAEKLMSLQDRWEATQARKSFDAAVAAAKAEIPPITRNATGHNSKKYADFAAIAIVVDPILGRHGLSYRFRTAQSDRISVTCILSHKDGHSEETSLSAPPDTSGNKTPIHAMGSTLTYLQRYSLVQMLGLAAAQDDDGKAATTKETITQKQADTLTDLIEAHGKNRASFLKWVNKAAKADRLEDIPADLYESCVDAIKAPVAK